MRYPTVCLPPGCRQLLIPLIVSRKMESLQQKEKEEEDAEEAFQKVKKLVIETVENLICVCEDRRGLE